MQRYVTEQDVQHAIDAASSSDLAAMAMHSMAILAATGNATLAEVMDLNSAMLYNGASKETVRNLFDLSAKAIENHIKLNGR